MINTIKQDVEERMNKTISVLRSDLASIRTGVASPALLDKITVDYYGAPTPINQMANISVPEPRMLAIQPWDKSAMPQIEKAIMKSDIGITPTSDGTVIRLVMPQLTQENRKDLVKRIKKKGEDAKVSVRNIRRDGNHDLKGLEKIQRYHRRRKQRLRVSAVRLSRLATMFPTLCVLHSNLAVRRL